MKAIVKHPQWSGEIEVPRTADQVRQQDKVPAWVLAWYALAPVKQNPYTGRFNMLYASLHTGNVLCKLERECGAQALLATLCGLLDDMANGNLNVSNPYGLLIHRTRRMATQLVEMHD